MKTISNKPNNANITPAVEDTETADLLQNLASRSNALEILHRVVAAAEFELTLIHSLVMVIEEVSLIDDWGERADYAGTLQAYLFSHTAEHNEAFLDYKRNLSAGMLKMGGFDKEESEQGEQPAVLDLSGCQPDQLNTRISELSANNELACVISGLLNNSKLPPEVYNGIVYGLSEISNKAAGHAFDTPEYISLVLENSEVGE